MKLSRLLAPVALVLVVGCASASHVNPAEPRRLFGEESGVRLDAQALVEIVGSGASIPLNYTIENRRDQSIGVADLIGDTSYEESTGTVVVTFGSEVPGWQLLPRLIVIPPGAKKEFTGKARFSAMPIGQGRAPRRLQVRLQFLDEIEPFKMLAEIPERAIRDAELAARLFPVWVEHNQTVETNTIPIRWRGVAQEGAGEGTPPAGF